MGQVLTTLAEDMEAIGLLPKREPQAKVIPIKPVVEAKKVVKAECDDEDDDEMEPDDDDAEEGVEGDEDDEVVSEDGDVVDEARRIAKKLQRTSSGAYRMVRTKRATAKAKRAGKKRRRSAAGKKSLRLRARRSKTSKYKRFASKLAAKHGESVDSGMGRVASLLDDVQRVLKGEKAPVTEGLSADSRKKVAHAFAQLALTADTLATKFEALQDKDLDEVREELLTDLREMASDYGDAAVQIRDGKLDESEESLSLAFEEDVRDLLGFLEVYDDCTSGKG